MKKSKYHRSFSFCPETCVQMISTNLNIRKKSVTPPSDKPKCNDSPESRKAYRVINTRRVWNFVEIVSFLVISMNNFKKRPKLDSVFLQSVFVLS